MSNREPSSSNLGSTGKAHSTQQPLSPTVLDPQVQPTGTPSRAEEAPGTLIGRYRLLEKVGEGGFGAVYIAEQKEPVKRRVALKIIKLGMDTKQVVARFEAERQALAMMDHPHIAKVLDAGATDTGRPFFVMELVRGIPITQYCDENHLDTKARLQLFTQVCQAIQHAHQKGIIHRDIKPSNILVSVNDGLPVPKVIDFGIAKATQGDLTDKTIYTQLQQFIGTPAYMSPEQAEMSSLDIDTRSDIYSLGVLLYELLVGKTPFDSKELLESGLDQMRQTIREKEPVRPSTRLGNMAEADRTTMAKRRSAEAPRLIHLLRGDLDWIAIKCLEKDRTRRYETANGLAMDITRHLNDEPVVARPQSNFYRVGKLVRRNKLPVAAAALVALALLVGFAVAMFGLIQARVAQTKEAQLRRSAQVQGYASDMKSAQAALLQQNRGMALQLLERYLPKPGEHDLRGIEWRYLWAQSRGDERITLVHPGMIKGVSLSPNGRYVASVALDGQARIWDVASERRIRSFPGATRTGFQSIAFSPGGDLLAMLGTQDIQIRETTNWSLVKALNCQAMLVRFSPDGRHLATGGSDGLRLWNWAAGTCLTFTNEVLDFSNLAFTADGRQVISAINAPAAPIQFWNVTDGQLEPLGNETGTCALAVSPDGQWLASGAMNGNLCLWNLRTKTLVSRFRAHRGLLYALAFSPDGHLLATGGNDQVIHLWQAGTTNKLRTLQGHSSEMWSVSFSADSHTLASSSKDGAVKIWSLKTGSQKSYVFDLPESYAWPAGLVGDADRLLVYDSKADLVRLLGLPSGQPSGAFQAAEPCVTWYNNPGLDRVVGVESNGLTHVWETQTGLNLRSAQLGRAAFETLAISPDNNWLVGMQPEGPTLYDLRKPESTRLLADLAHWPAPAVLDFSPTGQLLAYGASNYTVKVWDLQSGREKFTLAGPRWVLSALRFSPDGKLLAGGDWSPEVWLWSSETGLALMPPLKGHQSGIDSVCFSRDNKTVISASIADYTIRFWNVASGQEMLVFMDVLPPSAGPPLGMKDGMLFWKDLNGPFRVTPLPSLAEIDAAQAVKK